MVELDQVDSPDLFSSLSLGRQVVHLSIIIILVEHPGFGPCRLSTRLSHLSHGYLGIRNHVELRRTGPKDLRVIPHFIAGVKR